MNSISYFFHKKCRVLFIILYAAYISMKNKTLEKHAWGYAGGRLLSWDSVPDSRHSLRLTLLPTTPRWAFQPNARTSHFFSNCEEERERKGNKVAFLNICYVSSSYSLALSLSRLLLKETLKGQCHFPQFTNEEMDFEKLKITTLKDRQLHGSTVQVFPLYKSDPLKM